jgi:hypothetical protein
MGSDPRPDHIGTWLEADRADLARSAERAREALARAEAALARSLAWREEQERIEALLRRGAPQECSK